MRIDNPIGINAALTGSFSGSFFGDGSGLTNVAASTVEYANVLNKPTLLSGSAQIASQISGSFTAVSASIATRFDNLGTGFATDIELGAVSASLASNVATIFSTYATDTELANVSSSLASDLTSLHNTVDGLDSTYATDAQLINVSSSLAQSIQGVNSNLTVVSGSLATRIDNINTSISNLGSTYATDAELILVSSSFASTTSTNVQIARLNSGSFAGKIDAINTTISNLGNTYATDSELASVSSSLATRIATDEGNLTTAIGVNNTQNNRLAALEAATGSYQAGLTFNDTSGQGGIDFTNTSGTITAVATGLGTTDNVVFNNGTFNGSVLIDGNLIVSGSNTSLQVQNLQVADAFIYLNSGSNSTNPDMGFAGNYNDGTYHHAGFFRDSSDAGTFKVFENYGPEPDASIYIDTTHATFRLAPFAAAKITAASITGSLSGNASTASKLATARTITLGGDLTGNVSFDGSAGVTLTATIAADSVALGTDTTGNYVASLVAGTGISLSNNSGEGATPTITNSAPDQVVALTAGSNVTITGTYPNFTIASTDTNTTYTASTGLSLTGTAFSIDSSVVTLSGTQTLTGKTINASQLVDASVTNAKLANSSVTVTAGTGMSGGGAVSLGGSITLTNDDKGSSQSIFKNVAVSGQSTVVADTNNDTLTFAGAGATTITTDASTDTITISSVNTTYSVGDGGLTAVNFTTTRRDKLDGIAAGATNVTNNNQISNGAGYQTTSGTVAKVENTVATDGAADIVYSNMGANDQFRIRTGGASNAGWVEFATADDGTEPLYVRQYTGVFTTLQRTATLLDGSGNTTFPGDVTAYSSDERLKENVQNIPNALDKVLSLNGVTFDWKQEALDAGFNPTIKEGDAGVLAQQVQSVLPQAVRYAPFDRNHEGESISGKDYLTVQYEKLAPLFIEAIKEQQAQIELLKAELAELKNK